jgi:putative transposase
LLHRGGQSIRRLFKIDDWMPCCSLHAHTLLHPLCDIIDPQPAGVQDRDGAVPVLRLSRRSFPFMTKAFADGGYAGDKPASATIIAVEIVRKPPDQVGFAVHPRRWVVERFFAWISRNRRLWKDPEATLASARAFLYAAAVMILVRRLARST